MRRGVISDRIAILTVATVLALSAAPGRAAETAPVAPQWSPAAEYAFGRRFDSGDGVPQNFIYAFYWYSLAADAGYPRAQLALASHYVSGVGVTQNLVLGYAWANLAAAGLPKGSPEWQRAVAYRRIIVVRVTPAQLERAQQMSADLCRVAGDRR